MFKKVAAVLAVAAIITTFALLPASAATQYSLTPKDYITTDFDAALPVIVTTFTITPATEITNSDLALLDLFFSSNQMLAWQSVLATGPIANWVAVDSLTYHAFAKDGTPKKDRKLVTTTKRIILHLFFNLND